MVYLNAVERGGATAFPKLGLSIQPEPGTLVVWNNMTRSGRPNQATLHAGMPVEAECKIHRHTMVQIGRMVAKSALTNRNGVPLRSACQCR